MPQNKLIKKEKDWVEVPGSSNTLNKEFLFKNFVQAVEFINKVAKLAEENKHHPDISVSYNKVLLSLSTHEAKGVTKKDYDIAKKIDELFN